MIKKIPVILDTDIGQDIDDTWTLAYLLKCPEIDLKLITVSTDDTIYRTKITAKLLEIAGREDIPIGIGPETSGRKGPQLPWVANYDLSKYNGTVYEDGSKALADTVMSIEGTPVIVSIGPLTTIADALSKTPEIAEKARLIGMQGCVRKSHLESREVVNEYNVKQDIPAAQAVFTAAWDITITPLDTCAFIKFDKDRYQRVVRSNDSLLNAVIENYRIWLEGKPDIESTELYDTVAAYLALSTEWIKMERIGLRVDDEGYTREDITAKKINCAIEWEDKEAFLDHLLEQLLG